MDSSIPDTGFTLSIKSRDTANQITVKTGEDLQTAHELLKYHTRKSLDQESASNDSEPTEQLKTAVQQLQSEVENTIPANEITSFQDAFSQELEKLKHRISQLESDEPDNSEKWDLDKVDTPEPDEETADDENQSSVEKTAETAPEPETDQDNSTTLEDFRQNSVDARTDKIYEVIKQHAPIKRTEVGEHIFGHEIKSKDTEYKELCNSWPTDRVETVDTDGQAKIYQVKQEDSDDEGSKHTSICKECGAEFHGDIDEIDDKLDHHYEEEHERDYPELKLTGYTRDEFEDLSVAGQTEVVIRTLLNNQPSTLDALCNQIFQTGVKPPKDRIHHQLDKFWDKIIIHEDGEYSVVSGVESDPDQPSIYKLWKIRKEGEMYGCQDCGKGFAKSKKARTHRQEHGHLNWDFQTGGQLVDQWRQNSNQKRADTA